jgi:hypothetical protein
MEWRIRGNSDKHEGIYDGVIRSEVGIKQIAYAGRKGTKQDAKARVQSSPKRGEANA